MTIPDNLVTYGTAIITGASVLHAMLPPVSVFDGWPKTQKTYALIVNVIGAIGINWRREVQNNPSIGSVATTTTVVPTETKGA